MINRLVECKDDVLNVLSNHTHSLAMLTAAEWEKLVRVGQLLAPCEHATTLFGGEKYVSCSVVQPVITFLHRQMKVDDADAAYAVRFKEKLINDIDER